MLAEPRAHLLRTIDTITRFENEALANVETVTVIQPTKPFEAPSKEELDPIKTFSAEEEARATSRLSPTMIRKILNGEKVDDEKVLAAYYTKRDLERIEKEARRMQQDVMKRPEYCVRKKA